MTENLNAEVLLQFYIAFYTAKDFCVYCHLPLACFYITPFSTCSSLCITLDIFCSGLYFCLCLLTIYFIFSSLQCTAFRYSFCSD